MKQEVKNLWLDALRSGDYSQGTGYLKRQASGDKAMFCCLGVLCDLAIKDGVVLEVTEDEYDYIDSSIATTVFDGNTTMLPDAVAEWAGLENSDKAIMCECGCGAPTGQKYNNNGQLSKSADVNGYNTLWELNDHTELGFEGIANIIEAEF